MLRVLSGVGKRVSLRSLSPLLLVAAGWFVIFLWRLASLTPGLSSAEVGARLSSSSLSRIYNNPINAPHKLLQHLFIKLEPGHIGFLRLPSVLFSLVICFCFYKLVSGWFGRIIGLLAALIFASLPLLVICARQGTSEIMFFSPIILMWLYTWLSKQDSNRSMAWLILLFSFAVLVYTPGVLWWSLAAFIITRKRIISSIANVPIWVSALGLAVIAANIAVIILASIKQHAILKSLLLIPDHFQAINILKNTGLMVLSLFVRTSSNNALILGRSAILNILLCGLLVFGVYAMQGVARHKALASLGAVILALILAGLNNNAVLLAFCLPAIGIFIAAGLRYLYIEWRSIFPRNPVPKTFALALIVAVAASQLYFGLRYSLVAWPHSAQTRTAYVLK